MRNILAYFVREDGGEGRNGRPRCVLFPKEFNDNGRLKCIRIKRFQPTGNAGLILKDFEIFAVGEEHAPCPLYEEYGLEHFLVVQFEKSCRQDVVKKVVMSGFWVKIEDETTATHFKFFGHSPTQLRSRQCAFYSTYLERQFGPYENLISKFGNFEMKNVSKRAARIGLLLSTATPAVKLDDDLKQVTVIEDIEHDNFNFTDGCGLMSYDIAAEIKKDAVYPFKYQYEKQVPEFPSVYQIRFKGCKGILMLDETLTNQIALRKSMIKFDWNPEKKQNWLRIVEHGKAVSFPNSYSFLNLQFIRLLSALGVPDEVFLKKLDTYFEELARILVDEEVQVRYLCAYKRYDLAERILTTHCVDDETRRELKRCQATGQMQKPRTNQPKYKFSDQTKTEKITIKLPLDMSRLVFGVADTSSKLEYGCCYFQPTIRGTPTVLEGLQVVVAKSPSYHVGDIRVLNCVNIPECRHLVDCLVFPVNG